jgi:hypothetical protein
VTAAIRRPDEEFSTNVGYSVGGAAPRVARATAVPPEARIFRVGARFARAADLGTAVKAAPRVEATTARFVQRSSQDPIE